MPFGFTGEQTDANDLVYLRARYLNPGIGTFASLDPFEGIAQRPMSLNGYGWVEGNVVTNNDPSGTQPAPPVITTPIDWDRVLIEVQREIANRTSTNAAVRKALLRQGVVATPQLIAEGLLRLGAAGAFVTSVIPGQQPNGLICNAWEYQLGMCHPVWDNPDTYNQLALQTSLWWDIGDACLALPMAQVPIPQIQTQIGTQTLTEAIVTEIHLAFGIEQFPADYLNPFSKNLQDFFNALENGPLVYIWREWHDPKNFPDGIPLSKANPFRNFALAFDQAIYDTRVRQIHFNLEGILSLGYTNYKEFVDRVEVDSNGNCVYPGFSDIEITAWELCSIQRDQNLLAMTIFYENGSTSLLPSPIVLLS